ncbi:MAG TPA: PP2C family serine/threonine-protein phosphatase [Thermoanaerobaculia bacterium]|jgi:hypothetical protein|nr:PP2C family serine/threonine-protein phosphatase [Thermoanaerobaculia bacterium]
MTSLDQPPQEPSQARTGALVDGRWQVIAASQPGSSHLRRGERCADWFELATWGDALVLAVADGAGSAARGAEGAVIAATTAAELAMAWVRETPAESQAKVQPGYIRDLLRKIVAAFLAATEGLEDSAGPATGEAASRPAGGRSTADFSSTLLLAVLTPATLIVVNVGDGWLVARDPAGTLRALAARQKTEYANETFFLTSSDAVEAAVIEVLPAGELDAMALMTDGPAWFAIDLDQEAPSRPLFEKLFGFAANAALSLMEKQRELASFLTSAAVDRKTDDDKTLVLAVRSPGPEHEADDDH